MQSADAVYDHTKPWQSNEERLVSAALGATAGMTQAQIQAIRPPLPRVSLFPPRYGYNREPIGMRDLLRIDDVYPGARVDYAESQSGNQGSSFPALGVV